jgi:hypothetical protein
MDFHHRWGHGACSTLRDASYLYDHRIGMLSVLYGPDTVDKAHHSA